MSKDHTDWTKVEKGPCPHMQTAELTCLFQRAMSHTGPACCFFVNPKMWRHCSLFYRMCAIRHIAPGLWAGTEGVDFCCQSWRLLFLQCAEPGGGHLQGAFDIRRYPNDGKDVWRNFERVRFKFCPFCGAEARPSPDELRQMWEDYKC